MRFEGWRTVAAGISVLALNWSVALAENGSALLLPTVPEAPGANTVLLEVRTSPARVIDAPQTAASIASIRPMRPVARMAPETGGALPFDDITGSIASQGNAPQPASAPPVPDQPEAQPSAEPPPPAAAASAPHANAALALRPDDLALALTSFAAADPAHVPPEAAAESKRRLKNRHAIADFYAAHGDQPLWIEGDHFSAAARAALGRVDRAGEDGLTLSAYAVPSLRDTSVEKLAAAELSVSEAVVAYAQQAAGSRIDPLQIDRLITAKPVVPEAADILAWLSVAADADSALHDYNPPQAGYAALRAKLAELRQQDAPMAKDTIPSGPTLKPGMRDGRVPLIRARFGLDLPSAQADADGLVYDTRVAAAVADFQRANGLPASGILTAKTIAALSGGDPKRLENELVANMERWRWLPRDLGPNHILVNVPDFSLAVTEGDEVVHRARVVVGKPDHQTPIFSDTMRFIIVNPYWNVPLSIIKKEMLPKLAENPNYFTDHGYEVVERDGVTYVRQPPGDDNALGRIKFMFPNQHSVYLHDTNARALFGKDKRAFSHGCVRVDQPFKLAEVVLGTDHGWTEARVKKLIGGNERTINLPQPLPIHIAYFTAFVDDAGSLRLRDDIYGYSARVRQALSLKD